VPLCRRAQLFVGTLRGFDQSSNVVLSDCQERVFDTDKGVEQVQLLDVSAAASG
jgi:small nuclear ribonucleoprotein (snRNP)-like protein